MAKNIADLQRRLNEKVSDDAQTISKGRNAEDTIQDALAEFNQLFPDEVIVDASGNGSNAYNISSISSRYEIGYSAILAIEYPVGTNPPDYLSCGTGEDYYMYKKSRTQENLQFVANSPTTSQTIRVTHTARHVVNGASCTLNDTEYNAFLNLTACLYCVKMAAKYSGDVDGYVGEDMNDFKTKAEQWLTQSSAYRKQYEQVMGLGKETARGIANGTGDMDLLTSENNDFMYHLRGRR